VHIPMFEKTVEVSINFLSKMNLKTTKYL